MSGMVHLTFVAEYEHTILSGTCHPQNAINVSLKYTINMQYILMAIKIAIRHRNVS